MERLKGLRWDWWAMVVLIGAASLQEAMNLYFLVTSDDLGDQIVWAGLAIILALVASSGVKWLAHHWKYRV